MTTCNISFDCADPADNRCPATNCACQKECPAESTLGDSARVLAGHSFSAVATNDVVELTQGTNSESINDVMWARLQSS